jgi:hypothetical protein
MGKKEIRDLEDMLGSIALLLPDAEGGDKFHFFDEGYPYLQELFRRAEGDLVTLGMREVVEQVIQDTLVRVRQGEREVAQDRLIEVCSQLRDKSGTFAGMRKMYPAPARH